MFRKQLEEIFETRSAYIFNILHIKMSTFTLVIIRHCVIRQAYTLAETNMSNWNENQAWAVIIGLKRNNRKLQRKVKKLESLIRDQPVEDDLVDESSEGEEETLVKTPENEHPKEVKLGSTRREIIVDAVLSAGAILGVLCTSWIVFFISLLMPRTPPDTELRKEG